MTRTAHVGVQPFGGKQHAKAWTPAIAADPNVELGEHDGIANDIEADSNGLP